MAVQRIEVLGVPVDICLPQDLGKEILKLTEKPGHKQIVFLSIWGLLKARKKNDFASCVKNADLVLPISKSILKGAAFLKQSVPLRYNPFSAVINMLNALESQYKSLYLLGGRKKTVMAAEKNVRTTFKGIQIVGRYVGYYPKNVEDDIIKAIYKASPSLVLVSEGIKEKDCWSYLRRDKFSSSIFLYYKDIIGIFGGRRRRVKEKTFDRGLEIWDEILHNPLKIFLVFPFLKYLILLVCARLSAKKNRRKVNESK